MRFAENYSRWVGDKENLKYYKLKYAAQMNENIERLAFNYYDDENFKRDGLLSEIRSKKIVNNVRYF